MFWSGTLTLVDLTCGAVTRRPYVGDVDRSDAAVADLTGRLLDAAATIQIDVGALAEQVRTASWREAVDALNGAEDVLRALHSIADAIARNGRSGDAAVPELLRAAARRLERTGAQDLTVVLLAAGQLPADVAAVVAALEPNPQA